MFITLKNPKDPKETGMESIALRSANARGMNSGLRLARKTACVACQARKLRCTGGATCHRCKASGITCVFSESTRPARRRNTGGGAFKSATRTDSVSPITPPAHESQEPVQSTQPTLTPLQEPTYQDLDQFVRDYGIYENDHADADFALPEFSAAMASATTPRSSSLDSDTQPSSAMETSAPQPPSRLEDMQQSPHSRSLVDKEPSMSTPNGTSCSCIDDTLQIVQRFDDDEFRLTTLPIDQVLQLQKWVIFQCCKPLDCTNCTSILTTHTLVLIICDRLSEMFECISKRISNRIMRARAAADDDEDNPIGTTLPVGTPIHVEYNSAQLFDGTSGAPSKITMCTRMVFSGEIWKQYSEEEQIHMIRVLLRCQIRNFRQLLERVGDVTHPQRSNARNAKIKSMTARLEKASSVIEVALREVLRPYLSE